MKFIFLSLITFSLSSEAITYSEWKKLTQEDQTTYLSDESGDVEIDLDSKKVTRTTLSSQRMAKLKTKINSLIKKLSGYQTEFDTEVHDDYYTKVGGVQTSVSLYFSIDNKFLGANISYFQQGCSQKDENGEYTEEGGYYTDLQEAEKNDCVDNDVSWSGNSVADENLKELAHSDYMEWTGH
ncbi:MAG: hypothetical protein ACOVP4_08140 [Bacteriovoracaceae bacterium]